MGSISKAIMAILIILGSCKLMKPILVNNILK